MMIKRNDTDKNEQLLISIDLKSPVVEQNHDKTVFNAEISRVKDMNESSIIHLAISTDLYLDMLNDISKVKNEDELNFYFTKSINDNYKFIVNNSSKDHMMFFEDGMLCSIDDKFNEKIIRESYYE